MWLVARKPDSNCNISKFLKTGKAEYLTPEKAFESDQEVTVGNIALAAYQGFFAYAGW